MSTYSYKGKHFEESSGLYNHKMFIEGQFVTTDPLEANSTYEKGHFLSDSKFTFSFSDGYNTYSSDDPNTDTTQNEGFEFTIKTGGDAIPELWFIFIRNSAATATGTTFLYTMSTGTDARKYDTESADLASFDNANAEELIGQDSEEKGKGKVHREGKWKKKS